MSNGKLEQITGLRQNLKQLRPGYVKKNTSLNRATTNAHTFDYKRHKAAYETQQPIIKEAAHEKAPGIRQNAFTSEYEQLSVVWNLYIIKLLVKYCLYFFLQGWVALVPVKVIVSAPKVELNLLERYIGKTIS